MIEIIIDKASAIKIIKELTKNYDEQYTKIQISKTLLEISEIKEVMGATVFNNEANKRGWLLFVDPILFANWSHKCEYYFIISETEVISNTNCNWPPTDSIEIELITNI